MEKPNRLIQLIDISITITLLYSLFPKNLSPAQSQLTGISYGYLYFKGPDEVLKNTGYRVNILGISEVLFWV